MSARTAGRLDRMEGDLTGREQSLVRPGETIKESTRRVMQGERGSTPGDVWEG